MCRSHKMDSRDTCHPLRPPPQSFNPKKKHTQFSSLSVLLIYKRNNTQCPGRTLSSSVSSTRIGRAATHSLSECPVLAVTMDIGTRRLSSPFHVQSKQAHLIETESETQNRSCLTQKTDRTASIECAQNTQLRQFHSQHANICSKISNLIGLHYAKI